MSEQSFELTLILSVAAILIYQICGKIIEKHNVSLFNFDKFIDSSNP